MEGNPMRRGIRLCIRDIPREGARQRTEAWVAEKVPYVRPPIEKAKRAIQDISVNAPR